MYRITRTGVTAFNRLTGERMEKPRWPEYREYSHLSEWYEAYYRYVSAMKLWNAFLKAMPNEYRYNRPKLRHATEKGVPVSGLRDGARRKYVNGSGVSANSRILPHRYADEGDKGSGHRREIRRKERVQWLQEWQQEQHETEEYSAANWWDVSPVVEWDEDEYECEYCKGPCEL